MFGVFIKSTLVAFGAVAASLVIVAVFVPALGGVVDGNAWLMCVLCPLGTAWPGSAYTFWQGARLRRAHEELSAAHAALADAHQWLAEKASRDHMTGFLNRESFFLLLDGSRGKTDRGALMLIDADHFKRVNDSFGHLVGDDALVAIAAAIGRGVGAGGTVGRISGEEFAALLPGASKADAARVAERIRREVEAIDFRPAGAHPWQLTVSIGGTLCHPGGAVPDLMREADSRLYEAKRNGRNRTILDGRLQVAA